MRKDIIILIGALLFFFAVWLAPVLCFVKNKQRFTENLTALLDNKAVTPAQSVTGRPLVLATAEIKNHFPVDVTRAKEQGIKARQIKSITHIGISNTQTIAPALRDSVVNDTVKVKVAHYADKWLTFSQTIKNDTAFTTWQCRDSLTHLLYWKRPHRFLFVSYGRKQYFLKSTAANPHSLITNQLIVQNEK